MKPHLVLLTLAALFPLSACSKSVPEPWASANLPHIADADEVFVTKAGHLSYQITTARTAEDVCKDVIRGLSVQGYSAEGAVDKDSYDKAYNTKFALKKDGDSWALSCYKFKDGEYKNQMNIIAISQATKDEHAAILKAENEEYLKQNTKP